MERLEEVTERVLPGRDENCYLGTDQTLDSSLTLSWNARSEQLQYRAISSAFLFRLNCKNPRKHLHRYLVTPAYCALAGRLLGQIANTESTSSALAVPKGVSARGKAKARVKCRRQANSGSSECSTDNKRNSVVFPTFHDPSMQSDAMSHELDLILLRCACG